VHAAAAVVVVVVVAAAAAASSSSISIFNLQLVAHHHLLRGQVGGGRHHPVVRDGVDVEGERWATGVVGQRKAVDAGVGEAKSRSPTPLPATLRAADRGNSEAGGHEPARGGASVVLPVVVLGVALLSF